MPYDIELPDGTLVEIPDGIDPNEARKLVIGKYAGTHGIPPKLLTEGENKKAALTRGVANLMGIVPGVTGFFTGDYANAPLAKTVKEWEKAAAERESPELAYKKFLMNKAIEKAGESGMTSQAYETLKQLVTNPSITGLKMLEMLPDLAATVTTGGIGALAGRGVATAGKLAAKEAAEKSAKYGTRAAIGEAAIAEGASTGNAVFDEVYRLERRKGTPEPEARSIAAERARLAQVASTGVSAAGASLLPGIEKSVFGGKRAGLGRTALGEGGQELSEGVTGQLAQNVAARATDQSIPLSRNIGQAAAESAALGALMGGVAGVPGALRKDTSPVAPSEPTAPPAETSATDLANAGVITPEEASDVEALQNIDRIRKQRESVANAVEEQKKAEENKEAEAKKVVEDFVKKNPEATVSQAGEAPAKAASSEATVEAAANFVQNNPETTVKEVQETFGLTPDQTAEVVSKGAPSATGTGTRTGEAGTDVGGIESGVGVATSATGVPDTGEVQVPTSGGVVESGEDVGDVDGREGAVDTALTPLVVEPTIEAPVEPITLEAKPYRIDKVEAEGKPAWQAVDPQTGTVAATYPTRAAATEAIKAVGGKVTTAKTKAAQPAVAPTAPAGTKVSPASQIAENLRSRINLLKQDANDNQLNQLAKLTDQIDAIEGAPKKDRKGSASAFNRVHEALNKIEEQRESRGGKQASTEEHTQVEEGTAGKNILEVAEWIAANTTNPVYKLLADKVAAQIKVLQGKGVEFNFVVVGKSIKEIPNKDIVALRKGNGITVSNAKPGRTYANVYVNSLDSGRPAGTSFETVLHELLHAVTVTSLDFADSDPKLKAYKKELTKIFNKIKNPQGEYALKFRGTNAFENVHEMLVWSLTNPTMQKYMDSVEYSKGKSAWSAFVDAIRNLLGIPASANTALSGVLDVAGKLLTVDKELDNVGIWYSGDKGPSVTRSQQLGPVTITVGGKNVEVSPAPIEPKHKAKEPKTEKGKAAREAKEKLTQDKLRNKIDLSMGVKDRLIRQVQNAQRVLILLQEKMREKGVLTPDLDLQTAFTLNNAQAAHIAKTEIAPLVDSFHKVIESIKDALKTDVETVMREMDTYFVALTEPERRLAKYYERVELTDENETRRQSLMDAIIADGKELKKVKKSAPADIKALIPDKVKPADAVKLYEKIKEIVENDPIAQTKDIDSDSFSVAGFKTKDGSDQRMDSPTSRAIRDQMNTLFKENPEVGKLYKQARSLQQQLNNKTIELNSRGNYSSEYLQNLIAARGWKNYVPLRGAPTQSETDNDYDYYGGSENLSGELTQKETAFGGRKSAADNVITRTFAEATKAAARVPRKELTQVIRNLVEAGYITGKINNSVTPKESPHSFKGIFRNEKGARLPEGPNFIYHYADDGKIDVIEIADADLARAIRKVYQDSNPAVDLLNAFTSGMGQMHTRYNPKFWIKNFIVDTLTNSWVFAAEHGKGGKYIWTMATDLVENRGTTKAINFMRLYENNKHEEIKALAEKDSWYKDALEFIKLGGRVDYISGLSSQKQLDRVYKSLGPNKLVRTKEQIDAIIGPLTDGLELAARISSYRTAKTLPEFAGNNKGAAAYSKNLANFEQIGEKGKLLGSVYMFFRPSATGAVRAIDALTKGKYGKQAAIMSAAFGFGVYALAMALSDDDEDGRNRIATDDPDRWVRNWRIFIPGKEDPVQIPWGFGLGTIGAAVAQVLMWANGSQDVFGLIKNLKTIGAEGFLPLPFSQVDLFEHPVQAALDTVMPSAFRPVLQYAMNIDSLNRSIFTTGYSKYSQMYISGENIPESIKDMSRWLYDSTEGGLPKPIQDLLSPKSIQFWLNNYLSGVYNIAGNLDSVVRATALEGQKDIDVAKATMVLGGFSGTAANYDYRQYRELENEIKKYKSAIDTFKERNPDKYDEYADKYPGRISAVKYFDKAKNGELKKLQSEAKKMDELPPKERQEALKENRKEQNAVLREIIETTRDILSE
jgi:hypothetical protein